MAIIGRIHHTVEIKEDEVLGVLLFYKPFEKLLSGFWDLFAAELYAQAESELYKKFGRELSNVSLC